MKTLQADRSFLHQLVKDAESLLQFTCLPSHYPFRSKTQRTKGILGQLKSGMQPARSELCRLVSETLSHAYPLPLTAI